MIDVQKLTEWLAHLFMQGRNGRPCISIQLRHLVNERRTELVHPWIVRTNGSARASLDPAQVAEEIADRAQDEADQLGGMQRYAVVPYLGENHTIPAGRWIFKLYGRDDSDDAGERGDIPTSLDEASPRGFLAQDMRHRESDHHQEAAIRFHSYRNLQAEHKSLLEEHARVDALIRKIRIDQVAAVDTIEAALSQEHLRKLASDRAQVVDDTTRLMFDKAQNMIPLIAAFFADEQAGSIMRNHPMFEELRATIVTITKEQYAQLALALDETQYAIFMKAAKMISEDEARGIAQSKIVGLKSALPSTKELPTKPDGAGSG